METLVRIAQLLLSLSLLVVLHEAGHFLFARLFGTRVEKFYLFFNPWFTLFKRKVGDTEYGVGWLPLGGYVKIAGMVDESMDTESLERDPQPWEFRSKPAWQRLLMMSGGVMVNFALAMAIYAGVLWAWGESYVPVARLEHGVVPDALAAEAGFEPGDRIVAVGGRPAEKFGDILGAILLDDAREVRVERGGRTLDVAVPDWLVRRAVKENAVLFAPRMRFVVGGFAPGSPAQSAGMQVGDVVAGVDTVSDIYADQLRPALERLPAGPARVTVLRGGQPVALDVDLGADRMLGIMADFRAAVPAATQSYSLAAAIPAGVRMGARTVVDYVKQLRLIFSPQTKAYESLGGFITIGKIFPGVWDWESFWRLTAFLSVMLAVLNLLPIPALDGGHVLFLLFEIVTRRRPPQRFLEYAQMLGMLFLLMLVLYANGNDIVRLFK